MVRDREAFINNLTSNLPEQPGNHTRIKAMNRQGPKPLGEVVPKPVTVRQAITFFQKGAGLLDTRSKEAYIRLHIPGSVHIENDDQLSNRVGFVIPPEVALVLMLKNEQDYRRVVLSLARVGFENIVGYLADGIGAWQALGLPVASGDIQDISPAELADLWASRAVPQIVDVREPWEYHQGHIAGAVLIPLGQLGMRVQELDASQPVAVVCASGSRSQSAAALLGQKGFPRVYNLYNGMEGWARQGLPITRA
jgi:hydroxyacylglutathione hydrolase